ncbi:MAG: tRNA dihydrouridine synthase DusB [Oscillospiraceae bacterium]|nr:tRNA dihydrouridine synthase DusB [Oscillospiraceae bacterium]
MQISSLQLTGWAVLAPMAGVTDAPFRLLCHEQGAPLTYTEMISAKGYLCAPADNRAQRDLLHTEPGAGPTALQLFGTDVQSVSAAAQRILENHAFCLVDINMGCPAPKITASGAGSALMRDVRLAARIVRAAASALAVPVTIKMRIGWDDAQRNAVDFALAMEESGAAAVTVHGRTRAQQYAGTANWDAIGEVKARLRIPVLGNGDAFTVADAAALRAHTGCDGVMIGRGAMGNPWIFDGIRRLDAGIPPRNRDAAEKLALAARHLDMMVAWKGEPAAVPEMRKHMAWYCKGLHGAARMRVRINSAQSAAEMRGCLNELVSLQQPDRLRP